MVGLFQVLMDVEQAWEVQIHGFQPCVKKCRHMIALSNGNRCNIVTLFHILACVTMKAVQYMINSPSQTNLPITSYLVNQSLSPSVQYRR